MTIRVVPVSAEYGVEIRREDLEAHVPLKLTELVSARAAKDWDEMVDREMMYQLVTAPALHAAAAQRHVDMREVMLAEVERRQAAGETFTAKQIDEHIARLQRDAPWPAESEISKYVRQLEASHRRIHPTVLDVSLTARADMRK